MVVNLNEVARRVTLEEGLNINQPIGQVKETIKILIDDLTNQYELYDIIMMLRKHGSIEGLDTKAEREKLRNFLDEMNII